MDKHCHFLAAEVNSLKWQKLPAKEWARIGLVSIAVLGVVNQQYLNKVYKSDSASTTNCRKHSYMVSSLHTQALFTMVPLQVLMQI